MGVTDFFGKYAENYAQNEPHSRGKDLDLLVEMLDVKKDDVALDLATGTGFTAFALSLRLNSVKALDRTPEMLSQGRKIAQERGISNVEFILADVEDIPFEDASFEVVTSRRAPHHFPDKLRFMSEVVRVLKDGGRLGISDIIAPDGAECLYNRMERIRDSSHMIAETLSGWKKIFVEAGLTVREGLVMQERIKFEKWLSPVKMDSEEGMDCIGFIRNAPDYFREHIKWDDDEMSFVKKWGVVTAQK